MNTLILESANVVVDQLIERLCVELALTDTQHERAASAYASVGEWLAADGTELSPYEPVISPQGSIPLGTTVKPRKLEVFDADGVCLLNSNRYLMRPQRAYDLVLNRIREHRTYREKLNPQDRCIRLEYEDQLYLDIIPAVPEPGESPTRILIPNATRTDWDATDPKGFLRWFKSRQVTRRVKALTEKRADVEPMPANGDPEERTPLQRIVQLTKRRRDVYFDGSDRAPKSVLLTTLAGMNYAQQELSTDGTLHILEQLLIQAQGSKDVPKVWNPSNPGENLARHWDDDNRNYFAFLTFVRDFQQGMQRLLAQRGTHNIAAVLQELFDPADTGFVKRAVESFTASVQAARKNGSFAMQPKGKGLTTASAGVAAAAVKPSVAFPSTKFYGAS